jgi:uncharacterized protein (TIGR00369 family)
MTSIGETVVFDLADNQCFGCSQVRTDGLAMSFTRTGEKTVESVYQVPAVYRGMGGVVHGGIQAVLIDEAVSVAAYLFWPPGTSAVTAELNLSYQRPVPTEASIIVRGELVDESDRDYHATAAILDAQGTVLTTGTARLRKLRHVRTERPAKAR